MICVNLQLHFIFTQMLSKMFIEREIAASIKAANSLINQLTNFSTFPKFATLEKF
jgi:hypothetical protein